MANNYGAYQESTGRDPMKGNKKSKPKPVLPKNPDRSIKVSQSEINQIKKLGMKKSLEIAAGNKGSTYSGAVASFGEGVRRLYGDTRYQNAVYTPKASPAPMGTPTAGYATKPKSNFTYQTGQSSANAKPKAKAKDTSFKKSGVAGVLKSPEAKKAKASFNKKGLFPSLFGN
jgi:hypothetical protein